MDETCVDLTENVIRHINLNQFSEFSDLRILKLRCSTRRPFDVSPLVVHPHLELFETGRSVQLTIDPLIAFVDWPRAFETIEGRLSLHVYDLKEGNVFVRSRLQPNWTLVLKKYRVILSVRPEWRHLLQMAFLVGLELPHYAAFDGDLFDTFVDAITKDAQPHGKRIIGIESVREWVQERVEQSLRDNADRPYNVKVFIDSLEVLAPRARARAQMAFITGLGLPELAAYDGDLLEILTSLPEGLTMAETKEHVRSALTEKIREQVQNNGPTLFMDPEKMLTSFGNDFSAIVERKKQEIEEMVLYSVREAGLSQDLRPLWVTGWGFEVLKSKRVGLTTDCGKIFHIQADFEKLGLDLKTTTEREKVVSPVSISDELAQAVFWIAHFQLKKSTLR